MRWHADHMQGERPTGKVLEAKVGKLKRHLKCKGVGEGKNSLCELSSCCHPRLCKY